MIFLVDYIPIICLEIESKVQTYNFTSGKCTPGSINEALDAGSTS